MENLKNKKILITAGPTWVPIDSVRVISNIATGETGILLADKLERAGAKVTLLLGPCGACCLNRRIKVIRFKFFDELKDKAVRELKSRKYDILLHNAAVSDYQPVRAYRSKIKSGIKDLKISLVPTEKIINLFRKIDRSLLLVGFKLGVGLSKEALIKKARRLIRDADLDLAVANTVDRNRYRAYIVSQSLIHGPLDNKKEMADKLMRLITESLCKN